MLARLGRVPPAAAVCAVCEQGSAETCTRARREIAPAGADRLSACERCASSDQSLASLIDHTLLRPEATREQIVKLCEEARQFCFASVCVNPSWVPLCASLLQGTAVKVCTVVGFP